MPQARKNNKTNSGFFITSKPRHKISKLNAKKFEVKIVIFEKKNSMKEISVQELKELKDQNAEFQLIDVREPFEYEVSHLDGINIPLSGVIIESDKIKKDVPVVIHCRSGKRSAQAILLLEQEGYTNLSNLQGGILAWKEEFDPEMDVY